MLIGSQGTYKNLILLTKRGAWSSCYCGLFSQVFTSGRANIVAPFPLDRNVKEKLQRAISYITLQFTIVILFSHICKSLADCPNLILILRPFQAGSFISTLGKNFPVETL